MAGFGVGRAGPDRRAPLTRADPRLKIAAVTGWSFLLALTPGLPAALAGLFGSALLAALSGQRPGHLLKRLAAVNFFILFLWLVLPFSSPGEVVARLGPLEMTRQGLELAALLTVKGNAVALGAAAFFGAASAFELAAAAGSLGAPEKFIAIFALMSRYVQVIGQESRRLRQAMKIRGFRPSPRRPWTYRGYAYLIGSLLLRALDRSARIHAAMRCRGYNGRFRLAGDFSFQRLDWALAALMFILSGGALGCAFF